VSLQTTSPSARPTPLHRCTSYSICGAAHPHARICGAALTCVCIRLATYVGGRVWRVGGYGGACRACMAAPTLLKGAELLKGAKLHPQEGGAAPSRDGSGATPSLDSW
jgi:hypothetical protein